MLKSRFAFIVCGSVLVASVTVMGFVHSINRARIMEQFQDHQLHTVEQVGAVIQSELMGSKRVLRAVAAAAAREPELQASDQLRTQMACSAPPCFSGLSVYDPTGAVTASAGSGVNLDPAQVRQALDWARDPAHLLAVRIIVLQASGPVLVMVTPLPDAVGSRAPAGGFAAAQLQLDALFTDERPWSHGAALLVVNGRGDVVYRSGRPEMRMNNIFHLGPVCFSCHKSLTHVDRMMEIKHGTLDYSVGGVRRLGAVAAFGIEGEEWIAALTAPAASAVHVLTAELSQLGLIMLATVLALAGAVQISWRDSRRRMEEAAAAARRAHLERSHAELTALNAKLESAAIEWRTTVDTIDAAVVVLEPCGSIERMNRAAADTLPGPPFSWLGEASDRLAAYPPWDSALALAREAIDRGVAAGARVRLTTSGRTWDLWCRTPQGPDRRHTVVIVARDVTSVVQLQESLHRSETMAALGLVVAGVAHEVRNPLFAISSLVDAWSLRRDMSPAPLIAALRGEVARLKTLMTELLEYGTPSTSVLHPQPLAPVIDQAVRACAHETEAKRVRILSDVPADLEVRMDAHRLVRVFINLIQNAVQHAPAASEVTLTARDGDGSTVRVAVRDRGPGFAAEDLPRLFTPFFSRRAGGFGLGLAISERIVAEHGGDIEAATHPDGGALLTLSLPLADGEPGVRASKGASLC